MRATSDALRAMAHAWWDDEVGAFASIRFEVARVLRPGGLFFSDTINRTWTAWLAVIQVMQERRSTAFAPRGAHRWEKFIRPAELRAAMARVGLVQREIRGMQPGAGPLATVRAFRARARGEIGFRRLGELLRFGESDRTSTS